MDDLKSIIHAGQYVLSASVAMCRVHWPWSDFCKAQNQNPSSKHIQTPLEMPYGIASQNLCLVQGVQCNGKEPSNLLTHPRLGPRLRSNVTPFSICQASLYINVSMLTPLPRIMEVDVVAFCEQCIHDFGQGIHQQSTQR